MVMVVKLLPPLGPTLPESSAHRRVRIGSRAVELVFTGLLCLSAAVLVVAIWAAVFYQGEYLRIGPHNAYIGHGPPDSVAFSDLPFPHRLVYAAVAVVRAVPILMLFASVRRLFGLYAKGQVFSREAGLSFSRIGGWLCAYALSPFLCHLVLDATGYEIDRNWAHMASLQAFVLGLMVFVVGQVMQVGREIEEDREGYV